MKSAEFNEGAMRGLEFMLTEAQAVATFDALNTSVGHLTRVLGDWGLGYMHGVSLGASLRLRAAHQTIALRDA